MNSNPETYLSDEEYEALLEGLLNTPRAFDPRSHVIELLGDRLNVWPVSVLEDREDIEEAA